MLIRVLASGCVEDVFDHVGRAMINGGSAVAVGEAKQSEAAAVNTGAFEKAVIAHRPVFRNPLRALFSRQ